MAQQTQSSLFGPGLDLVQQAVDEQARATAMGYAKMEPGQAPVYAAARAGQAIGGAIDKLSGYEDPAIARARLLEEAKKEVTDSGIDIFQDSRGYYRKAFEALNKRGLNDEAMQVRNVLISEESAIADAALKRAQAEKEMAAAQRGNYVSLGKGGAINTVTGEVVAPAGGAEEDKAQSPLGRLAADLKKGRITQAQHDAAVAKLNHIPVSGSARERDVSTGVEFFRHPITGQIVQGTKGTSEVTNFLSQGFIPFNPGSSAGAPPKNVLIRMPDGSNQTAVEGSDSYNKLINEQGGVPWKAGTGVGSTEIKQPAIKAVTMYRPPGVASDMPAAMEVEVGSQKWQELSNLGYTSKAPKPVKEFASLTKAMTEYMDVTQNANNYIGSVNSALSQLEKGDFKTGSFAGIRTALGGVAEFFDYPEAAEYIKSSATDSQSLSATLNDLVKGIATSYGTTGKILSKELELSRQQVGSVGTTQEALHLILSLAKQKMEFQQTVGAQALKVLQSPAIREEQDPTTKNALFQSTMDSWIAANQPEISTQTLDKFRAQFEKLKKAKDAIDINSFNTAAEGQPRVFDEAQLKSNVGKFVTDKGVLYILEGVTKYEAGQEMKDSDGTVFKLPRAIVVPKLKPY